MIITQLGIVGNQLQNKSHSDKDASETTAASTNQDVTERTISMAAPEEQRK